MKKLTLFFLAILITVSAEALPRRKSVDTTMTNIYVTANRKTVRLSRAQLVYLMRYQLIRQALLNVSEGGNIANNETADNIITLVKKPLK